MGAEVIKVEHPGGDEARIWPPHQGDMGASFLALNAGKRGIVVDLKTPDGPEVLADLAAASDVLIENFKTGDMDRFGLGYDDLRHRNPRLVYTSISAFGRVGPRATEPGYEAVVQAYSGVMAATGEPDGPPVRTGPSVLDMATGVFAALATVTALLRRESTGMGGLAETSLLGTSMGLMSNLVSNHLQHGGGPTRLGTAHPQLVPYQAFATVDGLVFIAAGNENLYGRLCRAVGREDLRSDPRFVDNAARVENRQECVDEFASTLAARSTADVMKALRDNGVPATPVNDFAAVMADGQLDHLGVIATGEDPAYGEFRVPALPLRLDGFHVSTVEAAPRLGADTSAVMRDVLGYDRERIVDLFERGVIGGPR
jgi:formyl-CoA transferase/CoA:oxalate CoA-transferase